MMKSVLLRLEGPMQSWGTQSRFEERDTDADPSKSGVLGLVGAAMGVARDDMGAIARLAGLTMAVRVDREGTVLRDYHTAGGGRWSGREYGVANAEGKLVGTVVSKRYYLADASFLVALGSEEHPLVEEVARALEQPVFPLFLGRKSFVPSVPIHLPRTPVVDLSPVDTLRAQPWVRRSTDDETKGPERLRLVVECRPEDGRPRNDMPLSFALYDRSYSRRYVRTDWVAMNDLPMEAVCSSPVSG